MACHAATDFNGKHELDSRGVLRDDDRERETAEIIKRVAYFSCRLLYQ